MKYTFEDDLNLRMTSTPEEILSVMLKVFLTPLVTSWQVQKDEQQSKAKGITVYQIIVRI